MSGSRNEKSNKIRVGVIGCGWHSRAAHGPSLKQYNAEHSELQLAACCDVDAEAAESYRTDFGFDSAYTSYEIMLAEERLDAVWVLVPEQLTTVVSLKVMDAGAALLLEKPPGINTAEVIQLCEQAKLKNIKHRVAFNRRHVPLVRKLISKLQAQAQQGKRIYSLTYDMIRVKRTDHDFSTTAIHAIDAAKWIAGADYESLRFRYDDLSAISAGLVNITAEGTFRNGIRAQLNCYPHSGMARELVTVRGEGFTYELHMPLMENAGSFVGLICSERGHVESISAAEDWQLAFGFYDENASFLDALREGGAHLLGLEGDLHSSIQSVEIMDTIRGRAEAYYG
ncbi:Gfo/Idh/MocA family oxidoreductase [Paenibacillus albus]|uniref:Gfo/Idh/MocA family oxidoreductase n=1 Tax=Paenibacillus albus TaxID=2495582 RepID=A0A3S9ABF6_9BACL|nr:Gfo/Idh/MocA family oxidoreductase [Paenibacillus albus]AZN43062.1 Gfo/Idh/MocA family oxidoreductase [Paenibacillus albus]